MSLRYRLESHPETILDLARASRARYEEGLSFISQGKPWIGIYIAGYSAEMILKIAYFLAKGAQWSSPVKPELDSTLREARFLGVLYPPQGFHNTLFWMDLLIAKLNHQGHRLTGDFESDLRTRTDILYDIWCISMRYRREEPMEEEVNAFIWALSWLMDKRFDLWRFR